MPALRAEERLASPEAQDLDADSIYKLALLATGDEEIASDCFARASDREMRLREAMSGE